MACTQQQWLHERTSLLRHTYIACLAPLLVFAHAAVPAYSHTFLSTITQCCSKKNHKTLYIIHFKFRPS